MTPQLQQAIRLLQLSTLELQQEIQLALESNPLLEQTDLHEEIETKETVDSEILQRALDQTMEKYPLFRAVLRKGLFWFYLERRDIDAFVKEENKDK